MRKLLPTLFILFNFLFATGVNAQVTIGAIDPGPYGQGSSISVPIAVSKVDLCLSSTNVFELYLSNAGGDFNQERKIGEYRGFYSTHINGIIPSDVSTGTYKLRIKTTSPASTFEYIATVQILGESGPFVGITPSVGSQVIAMNTFGWCGSAVGMNKSIILEDDSEAPTTQKLSVKNEQTGNVQSYPISLAGYNIENLNEGYYTITISGDRLISGNIIKSTKSYLLLNVPSKISLQSLGSPFGCIDPVAGTGADISYSVNISGENGIQNNYPGSTYRITWGDGTEDLIMHCELMRNNGELRHNYKKTSCGEPRIDLGNGTSITNSFKVSLTSINPFCQADPVSITSYPKIFSRPIAQIDPSSATTTCINVPVVFTNSSTKGNNADCSLTMQWKWYVDDVLQTTSETFTYTFTTPGIHTVKLVASNDVNICRPSEDVRSVCVQNPPQPSFNFNGNSGATICTSAILKPGNTSVIDNNCNADNTYNWTITGGPVSFENNTTAASKEPEFKFSNPGIYKVILSVTTASCGVFSTPEQTIVVNNAPTAVLSENTQLCNIGTYNFNNTTTGPTKVDFSGTQEDLQDTYSWEVTGGAFTFEGETDKNSKYPNISFTEYKTYTVSVTHKNNCGTVTTTQTITFTPSPIVNAGTDQTICYGDQVSLTATISGDISSQQWVGGNGTFSPGRTALNPVYTPTAEERVSGQVNLSFQVGTTLVPPCNLIDDYIVVTIKPKIIITSPPTAGICTNAVLNYNITSNSDGTTFSWTATGSPNASGYQASGTGNIITDQLNNSDAVNSATVTYVITPASNGCTGDPFILTVTIGDVKNTITNNTSTVCSGQTITITGSQPTGGNNTYAYLWESSADNGLNWEVISGQTDKDLTLILSGTLSFRRTVNSGTCSAVSNAVKINAQPPIAGNTITTDQTICSGTGANPLTGNLATGGNGNYNYLWQSSTDNGVTWTDVDGAVSTGYTVPALTATTLYRRLVSSAACTGSLQSISNTVSITVNPNAEAVYTFNTDTGCFPFILDEQNIVAAAYPDRNSTYTWYADNVEIGTGIVFPGYTINTNNTAVVIKLQVTSSLGCTQDEMVHTFTTRQSISALFTQNVTEGCGTTTVNFSNTTAVVNGTTYEWNFGNGNHSDSANPVAQNYLPDPTGKDTTYTITLTVNTSCGSSSLSSTVLVKSQPIPVFSPDKTSGCAPFIVTFSNTSPGSTNTYYYDFGDGTPVLVKSDKTPVTHIYTTGTTKDFVVKMIAENSCGRSEASQYTLRVSPNTIIPELVVNSLELQGCAPLTVNFQNNTSGANSFTYDFGDGTTAGPTRSAPETVSHTFTKGGTYTVTLRASNGCSVATTTETITVYEQPIALFSADQTSGCPGLPVKFTNQSTGGVSYSWDFGDGLAPSAEFEPVHVFDGLQEFYTIKLTVINALGCPFTTTLNQYIQIVQPPVAKFNVLPSLQISIPDYTFSFEDESTNDPDRWEWDFGDGSTSSSRNPNHTYADTGSYKVTLKVTNQQNCFTIAVKTVQITGVPGYLFLPNSFMPNSATSELREFTAKGSGIASWNMKIFNKWGVIIWETSKLEEGRPVEGWDGTYQSAPVPQGVYYWKIEVLMINGTPWKGMSFNGSNPKRTGSINLIR